MKTRSCAGQAELPTRGTKRRTDGLLKSITTIAKQATPKRKPKQRRLPRSYRPRVGTANTPSCSSPVSTSPTTKQTFNHNVSTSVRFPFSPTSKTPRKPPTRKLPLRTSHLHPLPSSLSSLTPEYTHLSPTSHALLLSKAAQLSQNEPLILPRSFRRHKATTVDATLAFAQSEAGTAFCIRKDGLLLTAAHCVAEEEKEAMERVVWLVIPVSEEEEEEKDGKGDDQWKWWGKKTGEEDGNDKEEEGPGAKGTKCSRGSESWQRKKRPGSRIVGARCIAWDMTRDLALLKVTHAQPLSRVAGQMGSSSSSKKGDGIGNSFPCVKIPPRRPMSVPVPHSPLGKPWPEPPLNTPLIAIGHPSDEHPDDPPGVKAYGSEHRRILQLSSGRYLGIAPDKVNNPHDNSDTGAMRHDCWTYWGYSGGPIFERDSGFLTGVHVDWNPEEPAVKRAVPWVAVEGFLEGCGFWR